MNKQEMETRSEKLKSKWKAERFDQKNDGCFVWDGIVDYAQWLENDTKLMFLFKEAFSKNGETEWNIATEGIAAHGGIFYVGNQANQAMQYRVAEWAYAVESAMNGKKELKHQDATANNRENSRKAMLKSAWVNIRKIDGVARSNDKVLASIAQRDKHLLSEQIDLINPNIILCGGTFGIVEGTLFQNAERIKETEFCYEWNGRLIIKFRHPGRAAITTFLTIFEDLNRIPNKDKYKK